MLGTLIFNILVALICVLAASGVAIYLFFKKKFNYWKDRNVKHLEPEFPWGNFNQKNFTKSFFELNKELYDKTKKDRFVGLWVFFKPAMQINDPDLVRDIFVKDFTCFHDRNGYISEKNDPLSANLLLLKGTRWRNLRNKLSPVFTSGKIKHMFPLISEISQEFITYLTKHAENGEVVEVKDAAARYLTDVIASCAFGLKANSIQDPDSVFRQMGRRAIELGPIQFLKTIITFVLPGVANFFQFTFNQKGIEKYFTQLVSDAVEYRRKNNVQRNDFLQLLMQLQDQGYVEDAEKTNQDYEEDRSQLVTGVHKLTDNELAAQCFLFFVGGFETSSTTLQFTLYELALNQDIQDRCRQDIDKKLKEHNGQLTYECVQEMDYLDRVVSETLRKYPPIPSIARECNKDYKIPDTDVVIEKGMFVQVSAVGLQHDPQYYPQPDKYDPDRFLPEVKSTRHQYVYLPFGHGPRICIGNRFALVQIKIGLAGLLNKFQFDACSRTPIPVKMSTTTIGAAPDGGMPLKISLRK